MASWREGSRVQNVHLGSCRKMDAEAARLKARKMKAKALGLRSSPKAEKQAHCSSNVIEGSAD